MKDVIVKIVGGEKVYKCPYCGKESRYGERMMSHMYICDKRDANKHWMEAWNRSLRDIVAYEE